jgi:hypothetical protein
MVQETSEVKMIDWIIKYWLWLAILFSVFWGFYGCNYERKKQEIKWYDLIEWVGIFISEFIGSFAGWYCFSILAPRLQKPDTLGVFDIFLGTVAVIGITGYSYKIADKLIEGSSENKTT